MLMKRNPAKIQKQEVEDHDINRGATITSYREEVFIGPFPHPDILKGYGELDPTIPGKIIDMAMEESKHRRAIDSTIVKWQVRAYFIHNIFAIIAMCIILFVGSFFMMEGYAKEGAAIIIATCLGTVGIIITRTFKKDDPPQSEPK